MGATRKITVLFLEGVGMKGVVFTEFLDLMESRFGLEVADAVITKSKLHNGGAYTAVGTYDFRELVTLVSNLSETSKVPVGELVREFGRYLFHRLASMYGPLLTGFSDVPTFLEQVESVIHVEVRKLYPDAELPQLITNRVNDLTIELYYRSSRPLADFAEGLLRGCAEYFHEEYTIVREDMSPEGGYSARFIYTKK